MRFENIYTLKTSLNGSNISSGSPRNWSCWLLSMFVAFGLALPLQAQIGLTAVGPAEVECGEEFSVTIEVADFVDIFSFQFSVNWDESQIAYQGNTDSALPSPTVGNPNPGELTYSWLNLPATLPDGTVILTIDFISLGTFGTADVNITSIPTPIEVIDGTFAEIGADVTNASINLAMPELVCPADITVDNDPGICGAVVTYDDPMISASCPLSGNDGMETFVFTGTPQEWIVPAGVTQVTVEAWGAQGGGSFLTSGVSQEDGGRGGYSTGVLNVTPGSTLYVYVGGYPGTLNTPVFADFVTVFPGGWNGGGDGGKWAGAGGGASDVRYGGMSLNDRVIVAGGGGGGNSGGPDHGTGGGAGGLNGNDGIALVGIYPVPGGGATQVAGGTAGNNNNCCGPFGVSEAGSFGQGGGFTINPYHMAGGGGGWYGGGSAFGAGAGGGSSYIDGLMMASTTPDVREGNGEIRITYDVVAIEQTEGLPSGSLFPVGTTVNTFVLSDDMGNTTTCSFEVTVEDAEAPVIACPVDDIVITTSNLGTTGDCAGQLEWEHPGVTDNCGLVSYTVTYTNPDGTIDGPNLVYATTVETALASGNPALANRNFAVGVTTVTYVAEDAAGNVEECSFTVTVTDDEDPFFVNCPQDSVFTISLFPGTCEGGTIWSIPVADDNCGATVTQTSGPGQGDVLPVGTYTVVYTATDDADNTATCSFIIEVIDTQGPVIVCPGNVVISSTDPGECSWESPVGSLTPLLATANCDFTVAYEIMGATTSSGVDDASGEVFNQGTSTVTYTVTETASGQEWTCSFTVTVEDTEAPTIVCPDDIEVSNDPGICGAVVEFSPPVIDDNCPLLNVSGMETFVFTGAPQDWVVPAGVTQVTIEAWGAQGGGSFLSSGGSQEDGGRGGYSTGVLDVTPGSTLHLYVGGYPGTLNTPTFGDYVTVFPGGWNGGGDGGKWAGAGGGASDVRYGSMSLNDRVIVAGGGGGGNSGGPDHGTGGGAGGLNGNDGLAFVGSFPVPGGGATQVAGGAAGNNNNCCGPFSVSEAGSFGQGGGFTINPYHMAGGGGGWYGGGSAFGAGAGGGSSYIDGLMMASTTPDVREGNGEIRITYDLVAFEQTEGLPSGSVFPVGTTVNTFVLTDGMGNTATCSFEVTVEDAEAPVIVCPVDDIVITTSNLGTTGDCAGQLEWEHPGVTDNCGLVSYTVTYTNPDGTIDGPNLVYATTPETAIGGGNPALASRNFAAGVTTVTYVAEDSAGNVTECSFTVTVTDDEDPFFVNCPQDSVFTISLFPGTCEGGTIWSIPVADDNCGATVTQTSGPGQGDVLPVGTYTVVYTATDDADNTATCSFIIEVIDTQGPVIVCPGNVVISSTDPGECSWESPVGSLTPLLATANCDFTVAYEIMGATTSSGVDDASGEVFNQGTSTVTYTVTETASGQEWTCSFDVTVEDTEAPVIANCGAPFFQPFGPAFVSTDLGECSVTLPGSVDIFDNCDFALDVEMIVTEPNGFQVPFPIDWVQGDGNFTYETDWTFFVGVTTYTIFATDSNGNQSSCTYQLVVEDEENPEITCATLDPMYANTAGLCGYVAGTEFDPISVTDNCEFTYSHNYGAWSVPTSLEGATFPVGSTTVVWTVTDESGNTATCEIEINVTDEEAPEFVSCPDNLTFVNDVDQCSRVVTFSTPGATDNCSVTVTQTMGDPSGSTFDVGGPYTIEFTATDGAGNTAICSFEITIIDGQTPTAVCQDITVELDANGEVSIVAADIDGGSSDNCGAVNLSICPFEAQGFTGAFAHSEWTFNPNGGDGSVITTPTSVTIEGSDNDTGDDLETTYCIDIPTEGTIAFDWDFETSDVDGPSYDPFGYSVNGVFTQLTDDGGPDIQSGSVAINLNEGDEFCFVQLTTDNILGSAVTISNMFVFECEDVSFDCSNVGNNNVTLLVTDENGNASICVATVTVEDNIAPTFTCPADVVVNSCEDTVPDLVALVSDAADNCEVLSITQSVPAGSVVGVTHGASIDVTVTVADVNGNETSCDVNIEVVDETNPEWVTCSEGVTFTVSLWPSDCEGGVIWSVPVASDDCGTVTVTQTGGPALGTILTVGTYDIEYTATDENGNFITCSFTIEVVDTEDPVIVCPGNVIVASTNAGVCTWTAPAGSLTPLLATANCEFEVTYEITGATTASGTDDASGEVFEQGTSTVTYTITETASGQEWTCSFDVTVEDTEAPTIVCPDDIEVSNDPGICGAVVEFPLPEIDDNCPLNVQGATETFTFSENTETWVVPAGVTSIEVEVCGAQGGTVYGGGGACLTVELPVTPGDVLEVYAGAQGATEFGLCTTGEGGQASYIALGGTPLVVAAGGGGGIQCQPTEIETGGAGNDALVPINGTRANNSFSWGTAGAGGNGGAAGAGAWGVGGGGGWFTPGGNGGGSSGGADQGGASSPESVSGGFFAAGSGGGYNGGGGADMASGWGIAAGSGGGSYFTGTLITSSAGSNLMNGLVTISYSGGGSLVQTAGLPSGSVFPVGTTTNTFVVTDNAGNTAECSFDVTVTDDEAPVVVCPDDVVITTSNLGTLGDCAGQYDWNHPTASDNCSVAEFDFTYTNPDGSIDGPFTGTQIANGDIPTTANHNFQVGVSTVTYYTQDAAGNTASCSFTVTVSDDEDPTFINCPSGVAYTIGLFTNDCEGGAIWSIPVADDNCGATVTQTDGPAQGEILEVGVYDIEYTATDAAGNTATCNFSIEVIDTEEPVIVCPANVVIADTDPGTCTWTAPAGSLTPLLQFSNCPAEITYSIEFPATMGVMTAEVAGWNFDDAAKQVSPNLPYTADSGIPANANVAPFDLFGGATFTAWNVGASGQSANANNWANGAGSKYWQIQISTLGYENLNLSSKQRGSNTGPRDFEVEYSLDGSTWTVVPGSSVTVANNFTQGVLNNLQLPAAVDNQATVYLRWIMTSNTSVNGNTVANTGTSRMDDLVILGDLAGPTANGFDDASGETFPQGVSTVTYTITELASGQSWECSFTVTVEDNEAPVIAGCPNPIFGGIDGVVDTDPGLCSYTSVGIFEIFDNCDDSVDVEILFLNPDGLLTLLPMAQVGNSTTYELEYTFQVGITTYTIYATDSNGNQSTCSYQVVVEDNELPVIECPGTDFTRSNTPGLCGYIASQGEFDATASDNCELVSLTHNYGAWGDPNSLDGATFPLGTTTVVWTAVDASGNTVSCEIEISVFDTENPSFVNCPTQMIMIGNDPDQCSGKPNWSIPLATDNCELVSIEQIAGPPVGSIVPVCDLITVTYEATDDSGNTSTCSFEILVIDTQKPEFDADIVMPGDITVECDAVPAPFVLTNNDVNDNCTAPEDLVITFEEVSTQDPNQANCGHYNYTITRTWTVTDEECQFGGGGNSRVHVQVITVEDTTPPMAVCQDITITLDIFGNATINPIDLDGGSTDNCAAPEFLDFEASQTEFDCSNLGENTVILTVTDPCGNSSTCEAIVTVVEGIAPCVPEYDIDGSDPCVCLNNATTLENGQFGEFIQLEALAGQTWTLISSTGLYLTTSPAPPASPIAVPNGTVLTVGNVDGVDNDDNGQTDEFNEQRFYVLEARHIEGVGYSATFQNNLGEIITLSNKCYYPTPVFVNLDGPFCLNTTPFEILIEDLFGANGNVIEILINGVPSTIFDAAELGVGSHVITAIFDAGGATPYTIVNGVVVSASDDEAQQDPGCQQPISTTVQVVGTPSAIACNDLLQVSIDDADCQNEIFPDMLLEGSYFCYDDYSVILTYPQGTNTYTPPNIVDGSHAGYTLNYTIFHTQSGNVCWGQIAVEDKLAPNLTCPEDIQIFCTQNANNLLLTGNPVVTDCSQFAVEYSDDIVDYTCSENTLIRQRITRTWIAADIWDNADTCVQIIEVLRGDLDQIVVPNDVTLLCTQVSGDLNPDVTGWPTLAGINLTTSGTGACGLGVQYTDDVVNECPGSYYIIRTWKIFDFCPPAGGPPVNVEHVQYINVEDVAPTITLSQFTYDPDNDWYVVSANEYSQEPHQACVTLGPLPIATVDGVCNEVINAFIATPVGNIPMTPGALLPEPGLTQGTHQVTYTVEDECGNVTQVTVTLYVVDNVSPVAICTEFTDVNLSSDGLAIVNASSLDNGSYDNCCLDYIEVRRMDGDCDGNEDDFGPDVTFCCSDVGTGLIMVVFRAYDCNGNYNDCMVSVEVNDKISPINVLCPQPQAITCDDYLDNYAAGLELGDWSVLDGFGEAVFTDNCDLTVDYDVVVNINTCAAGTITRTWVATDAANNSPATCTQTITVNHVNDWEVLFPADLTITCENGVLPEFGEPEIFFDECELIAVSYEDQQFDVVQDACYKIVRTWSVINWCVFDQFGANTEPDPQVGVRRYSAGADGFVVYEQTIKVIDEDAPIFSVGDQEYCIESSTCETDVTLPTPDVTDCSDVTTIVVTSNIPGGVAGNQYQFNNVTEGTYTALYEVTDNCGNVSYEEIEVTVVDCKKPTPYCVNGLVIEIMQTGMVDVWAADFDAGSFDNCSDVMLSFSPDVNNTSIIFTCDDLGQNVIQLWVTDAAGNQDYCETFVNVQDNMNHCNGGPGVVTIAGLIATETDEPVADVMVDVNGGLQTEMTPATGAYSFDVPAGGDYTITPMLDANPLNGVTTFDLVLIQRHILGVQLLDSPYKMIAADANKSNTITTFDLLTIRRVILFIDDNFQNNTSWRFVPTSYAFPNPANPFAAVFPEVESFNNLQQDELFTDFVGVKVGDVNGSVLPNANADTQNRTMNGSLFLEVEEQELQRGQTYAIPVQVAEGRSVLGYQFTLELNNDLVEILHTEAGLAGTENTGLSKKAEGAVTTSWNRSDAYQLNTDETLFHVVVRARTATTLSEVLGISSRFTAAEAYSANGELLDVQLSIGSEQAAGFVLYQNVPNPFDRSTMISFRLPEASKARLSILDVNGKVLRIVEGDYAAGYNEVRVSDLGASGVLYYRLETGTHTAVRSMIVVE